MKTIKSFKEFLGESFTLTTDQLPEIGSVVDNIEYKEGDKIAFINFGNMRNIPVRIETEEDKEVIENK